MIYHISDWSFVSISMDFNRQAPERKEKNQRQQQKKKSKRHQRGRATRIYIVYAAVKQNTLLAASLFVEGDYRTLLERFLATPLMRMQLHTGLCVNIMQATMLIVTFKDMRCRASARWLAAFFVKPPYFSFLVLNAQMCLCMHLSWFVAAYESHASGLTLRTADGALAGPTEASSGRWGPPPQNTRTHTDTLTHKKTQPPVSYASLPTPGCISGCNTVAMPDVSSTGRTKLFLGRCAIHSVSSNSLFSKHTMWHLNAFSI